MSDPNTTDGRSVEGGSAKPVQIMNLDLARIKNTLESRVAVHPGVPTIYNVTLTSANTEYSQALPANVQAFEFQCRTAYDVRYAFVTGKVATPTAPYMTLKSGNFYYSDRLQTGNNPPTLFLASAQAGVVVEITAWV